MIKLARLLRLARLFQNMSRLSQHSIVVLGLLMFTFTLVAHWFACIWYVIGLQEVENSEAGKNDWFGTYIDTSVETMQTVRSRCGVKSLTYCDLQSIDLITLNNVLDQYPKFKSDFVAYLYEDLSFDIQEGAIISFYPEELRRDIALHLNRDLLSLKVFENASQDCLKSLAVEIKTTFFTPGEYLIHAGDVLRRLYFVCSGSLEVLDNDEVVALLGKNDWFGTYIDTSVETMQTVRSRCGVKSLTYCDLQSIDLITLNNVLDQYPKFKSDFVAYLYEDLSFDIQEGAMHFRFGIILSVFKKSQASKA
ncbi:hypothetical protein AHF37_10174 [Paragonimus kellicotti]|nr:hypothetical protein AHF37_10174 [Paragonimus kellicotti]